MDAYKLITLGGKVRVKVGKCWYGTIIEGLAGESVFYISPPMSKQMKVSLEGGQVYTLKTINKRGLFEFDVRALETKITELNANIPMTKLQIISEPRHLQRRDAFRTEVIIDVIIREYEDKEKTDGQIHEYRTKTLNISENGMLFLAKKKYSPGTPLRCDIVLNKFGMNITLQDIKAEVIRTKKTEFDGTQYQVGVNFEETTKIDKRSLVKFIMTCQRERQNR